MPYCKERLECKHFDTAGCSAEIGTGCFEEIEATKTATSWGQLKRLVMCRVFKRHKYFVIKEFSKTVRKVGCKRCGLTWGMNDRVKAFLPWDGELAELYEDT